MSEKIKTNAVLCALPDELIHMMCMLLRHNGLETMEANTRDEMLALLQSHTFRGMVTVSSWLPEDEVMARNGWSDAPSIKDIPTLILVEPQHDKYIPSGLRGPDPVTNHDWVDIPFDIQEVILRLGFLGILPRK